MVKKKKIEPMKKKMVLWFDLTLTYEEISKLERLRGKRTQMEYVEDALREKMTRDEKAY